MDRITWTNEKRKISDLSPAEYNPRQLTEKQAKDLDASLERFNLCDPIIINADNKIIGGHQRINILKQRGAVEVDVRVPSRQLTEHEEKELNLRLNKNLGEWDFDLLANFDQEMLLDVGFDTAELDKMFNLEPDAKDDDVPEPPKKAISKTGDIWLLGRHRVMCGDSTKIDDVEKLMDGKKADITFHSPPYNVGHNLGYKNDNKYENYKDDNPEYDTLLNETTNNALNYSRYAFVNLQFLANNKRNIINYLMTFRDVFVDILFWKKSQVQPAMANNVLNSQVECIFVFSNHNQSRAIDTGNFRGNLSNFIETNSNSRNEYSDIHNAGFPVELAHHFVSNFSKEIVIDLFMGTGTTLIACEKTNRICYGMEIDPIYCDVIVKRWEDFTGRKAVLDVARDNS